MLQHRCTQAAACRGRKTVGGSRRGAKQAVQAAEVIVKITGPSAKIATAMATMTAAMPTAIAKPRMRGVLEMFIAFYNIDRRDIARPLEALCVRGSRSSPTYVRKGFPEAPSDRLKQRRALVTRSARQCEAELERVVEVGGWERLIGGCKIADRSGRATGIALCVEPSASSSRPS
jgi:hypothetical protein